MVHVMKQWWLLSVMLSTVACYSTDNIINMISTIHHKKLAQDLTVLEKKARQAGQNRKLYFVSSIDSSQQLVHKGVIVGAFGGTTVTCIYETMMDYKKNPQNNINEHKKLIKKMQFKFADAEYEPFLYGLREKKYIYRNLTWSDAFITAQAIAHSFNEGSRNNSGY